MLAPGLDGLFSSLASPSVSANSSLSSKKALNDPSSHTDSAAAVARLQALTELNRGVWWLSQLMSNAADGCMDLPAANRNTRLFFRSNRKVVFSG